MTIFFPNLIIALASFGMVIFVEGKVATIGTIGHLYALLFVTAGLFLIALNIIDMLSGRSKIGPMDDMDIMGDKFE